MFVYVGIVSCKFFFKCNNLTFNLLLDEYLKKQYNPSYKP